MHIIPLALAGLKKICPCRYEDARGFFQETYRKELYAQHGIGVDFVQDNHSYSKKGVVRGMHFQRSPGQAKLVGVVSGRIFDVAVDIRLSSPSFGKWEGVYLEKGEQLWIPVGFAHGFCVVSRDAHVIYKVSAPYDPAQEVGFAFDDPDVGINWPILSPVVSERDRYQPAFKEAL